MHFILLLTYFKQPNQPLHNTGPLFFSNPIVISSILVNLPHFVFFKALNTSLVISFFPFVILDTLHCCLYVSALLLPPSHCPRLRPVTMFPTLHCHYILTLQHLHVCTSHHLTLLFSSKPRQNTPTSILSVFYQSFHSLQVFY